MRALLFSACAIVFGAATAQAQGQPQKQTQKQTRAADPNVKKVLQQIHDVNQRDIEVGKMAEQQAMSEDVKEFGKNLRESSADLDKRVMDMAKKKGIQLETGMVEPTTDLSGVQGQQFDRQFLTSMIDDHGKTISELSQAPMDIRDEEVEGLIDEVLPDLHDHYEKASTTLAKLGSEKERKQQQQQQQQRQQQRPPQGG